MLMNDKNMFDRCYCINSAQTKEIIMHYILQLRHIFISVKDFIFILVLGGLQLLFFFSCVESSNEHN